MVCVQVNRGDTTNYVMGPCFSDWPRCEQLKAL